MAAKRLLLLLLLLPATVPAQFTNRPNILVILADDLGWTDISQGQPSMNHPSDFYQTPNIAKLAQQGLSFTSCYMSPNCAPLAGGAFEQTSLPKGVNHVFRVTNVTINQAAQQLTLTWNSETGFVYSI